MTVDGRDGGLEPEVIPLVGELAFSTESSLSVENVT